MIKIVAFVSLFTAYLVYSIIVLYKGNRKRFFCFGRGTNEDQNRK
jgi:hypothetical protein